MAELRRTGEEGVGSSGALLGGRGGGQRLQFSGGSGVVRAAPLRGRGAGVLRCGTRAARSGTRPFPPAALPGPQHLRVGGLLPRPRLPRRRLGVEAGDDIVLPQRSYRGREALAAAEPQNGGVPPTPRAAPIAHLHTPQTGELPRRQSHVAALSRAFWPMGARSGRGISHLIGKGGARSAEGKAEGGDPTGPSGSRCCPAQRLTVRAAARCGPLAVPRTANRRGSNGASPLRAEWYRPQLVKFRGKTCPVGGLGGAAHSA